MMRYKDRIRKARQNGEGKPPWPFGLKEGASEKVRAIWESLTEAQRLCMSKHNPFRKERDSLLIQLHRAGYPCTLLSDLSGLSSTSVSRITQPKKKISPGSAGKRTSLCWKEEAMRKRVVVKVDDKEIELRELTIADILEFKGHLEVIGDDTSMKTFFETLEALLPKVTSDLTLEDLRKMAPSEVEKLVDGFKEANRPFFNAISWAGLGDLLDKLRSAVMADLLTSLSGSQSADITGSGSTASATS